MKTIAFIYPPLTDRTRKVLTETLGAGWVEDIAWHDCENPPRPQRLRSIIEREKPQLVVALGSVATAVLPKVMQICNHTFGLYRAYHPGKVNGGTEPPHRVRSSLRNLRTVLNLELNTRTVESGANK